jgi:hypothetical protein
MDESSADSIGAVLARMETLYDLVSGDERRHFHTTYRRTTKAIADAVEAGHFVDGDWVERWDVRFAESYLDALEACEHDAVSVPSPWRVAFAAAHEVDLPPLRHVLLGMNAHINYDLPQAIIAVMSPDDFDDPEVVARREDDHRRVDDVLSERVSAEDHELQAAEAPGTRTLLDRLLTPLNRMASRRFIAEARRKVWHNAKVLDRGRRAGPDAYDDLLSQLAERSAVRVADLRRPGQVVLRLARHGFGVMLEEDDAPSEPAGLR